jgi:predicted TIM-barrel fold metal-dependent hydrolase
MVPHGGGMIPYQVGRLRYQGEVFGAKGGSIERDPLEYLDRLFFDTVVHEPASLELLIEVMGPDNVVMGSNYPGWDNAPIWETIKSLDLDDETKEKVLGRTAAERLFREEV